MKIFSDETLMAYADGELDPFTRLEVEQAIMSDPEVAARVGKHRTLRSDVFDAFADTLGEPVPARLQGALRPGRVVQLDAVRAARAQAAGTPLPAPRRRWSWPEWGSMAAMLAVGVFAGSLGMRQFDGGAELAVLDAGKGALQAQGKLALALSEQLSGAAPAGSQVRIGLSFKSKEGNYCRSFALGDTAGLACRNGAGWTIPVLSDGVRDVPGAYRRAGNGMPEAVIAAIDERIDGLSLDAAAEQAAQQKGWAPAAR
jgi:hypothetical protein